VGEHRFKGIESDAKGHRAVCSCGWRSDHFSTAGLAGSVWDEHSVAAGNSDCQGGP
jgi:hypothetical protein